MSKLITQIGWLGARAKAATQWARRMPRFGTDPSLLIVGAQRAGSTSLFRYLAACPGFAPAQRKEVRFFHIDANYNRGLNWYRKFFEERQRNAIHFEATPEYLFYAKAADRIYSHYPHIGIIIILRDPVARAYSAWNMYYTWACSGRIPLNVHLSRKRPGNHLYSIFFDGCPPSFGEYVDQEMQLMKCTAPPDEPSIIRRGIYADQVGRYLDLFGPSQVLILGFNELRCQPEAVVQRVAAFAHGSEQTSVPMPAARAHNAGAYDYEYPRAGAERLAAFYEPHNERLWERLGYYVDW